MKTETTNPTNRNPNSYRLAKRLFLTGMAVSFSYLGGSIYQEYKAWQEYNSNSHLAGLERSFNEGGLESASKFDSENYELYQDTLDKYFSRLKKSDSNRKVAIGLSTISAVLPMLIMCSSNLNKRKK